MHSQEIKQKFWASAMQFFLSADWVDWASAFGFLSADWADSLGQSDNS
jgi:hypothetical protein